MEAFLLFVWKFILEIWPLTVINKWELGLRVRAGKWLKELKPGVRVSLPFIDVILTEPATLQTVNLTDQTVITLDGINTSVGGVIYYYVRSLKKLWLTVHDHDEALSNLALTALAAQIADRKFEDCTLLTIARSTQRKLRHEAKKWGIYIEGFELTDLCESKVFRLMAAGGSQTLILDSED